MAARQKAGGANAPSEPVGESGVAKRTVKVETPDIQAKNGIPIVTTETGAGPRGLIPVGTEMTVTVEMFSARWMRPRDEAAVRKLARLKK